MNRIAKTSIVTALSLAALASLTALAQGAGRQNRFLPSGSAQVQATAPAEATADATAQPGPRHPASPLVAALDANKDGVIDETEIANAAVALKALDTNGDGKLTVDEIRPAQAGEGRGPGRGQGRGPRHGQGPRPDCPLNAPVAPTTGE